MASPRTLLRKVVKFDTLSLVLSVFCAILVFCYALNSFVVLIMFIPVEWTNFCIS